MFKNLKKLVFAFVLVLAFAGSSFALKLTYELYNSTGLTIYRIYMKPSEIGSWSLDDDEIVGDFPIENGEHMNISVGGNKERRYFRLWDIGLIFQDSHSIEFKNVDIDRISRLIVDSNGIARDNFDKYYQPIIN